MTNAVAAGWRHPGSIDVTGILIAAAKRIRRGVEDALLSDAERQVRSLLQFATARFGREILAAEDVADLDDRLDDSIGEPDLNRLFGLLASRVAETGPPDVKDLDGEPLADFLAEAAGEGQRSLLNEAEAILRATMGAHAQIVAVIPPEEYASALSLFRNAERPPWDDPDVPPEVGAALASAFRSQLCLMALLRAKLDGQTLQPWLARALAERLVVGLRANLRLIASVPDIQIDESVLPRSERLDLEAIGQRHVKARARAAQQLEEARRSSPSRSEAEDA